MIIGCAAASALVPPAEPTVLLIALDFALNTHDFVTLINGSFEIIRCDPIIVKVDTHPIGIIHADLYRVISINPAGGQVFLLSDGSERDRFAVVVVRNEIDPMCSDIAERIALLDPFKGARSHFKRFLKIGKSIKRRADAFLDLVLYPEVVRVIAFMHIDRDEPILFGCQFKYLVGFMNIQAQWLFCNYVRAMLKRGHDYLSVQMVRSGHSDDIQSWKITEELLPGRFTRVAPGLKTGEGLEVLCSPEGGLFGTSGNGNEFEFDLSQVASPRIQAEPSQLWSDARTLQVGISAKMHVASKHACANQSNFESLFHDIARCRASVAEDVSAKNVSCNVFRRKTAPPMPHATGAFDFLKQSFDVCRLSDVRFAQRWTCLPLYE